MPINRRRFLGGAGAALTVAIAGCTDSIPDDAVEDLPAPTQGVDDAPVTVEIFEDFGCPHCKEFNAEISPKLTENYASNGNAKIEFHDYPVPVTDASWPAAMCARAVQDRTGDEDFWTYAQYLFDNQGQLGWNLFREAANELDLDGDAIVRDGRDNKYRPVVQADYDYGDSIGVSGTPTVFVEGERVSPPEGGTYDDYYQSIATAIEENA